MTLDLSIIGVLLGTTQIFKESALRPILSISLSVCVSVRHTPETTLPDGLETSGRRAYR